MKGQGSAKSPATIVTEAKRSSTQPAVIAVEVGAWRLRFALDEPPSTGWMRDTARTAADITGAGIDQALTAVIAAVGATPSPRLEQAA